MNIGRRASSKVAYRERGTAEAKSMAWLIVKELPELSRGGLATGKTTAVRQTLGRIRTLADCRKAVESTYPGYDAYGPVGESVPAGAPLIALSVYTSKSRDGVGRVAGNMEVWRVVPRAKS